MNKENNPGEIQYKLKEIVVSEAALINPYGQKMAEFEIDENLQDIKSLQFRVRVVNSQVPSVVLMGYWI
jgi:hypothetical protein